MFPKFPRVTKSKRIQDPLIHVDVLLPSGERPSSKKVRPRGRSTLRPTAGPVNAPWAGDSHWGQKVRPWSLFSHKRSKISCELVHLPVIDGTGHYTPDLDLPHCLDRGTPQPFDGKSGPNLRKLSSASTASTAASWADQLAALGSASKENLEPAEPRITVSPAPQLPISNRRPSIQEELYGPGATLEHAGAIAEQGLNLRPSSARSDSACSATSVHFEWINGQLTPMKDEEVTDAEKHAKAELREETAKETDDCKVVHRVTAERLAQLGTEIKGIAKKHLQEEEPSTNRNDGTGNRNKGKKKSSIYNSTESSGGETTKSAKSNRSEKSDRSTGSVRSTRSLKVMSLAVKALQAFQRPLRKGGRHAHRGRYECQYCFEDLEARPVAVLVKGSRRCCNHLYHRDCAAAIQERSNKCGVSCKARCPSCKNSFESIVNLPDPAKDPAMWFNALDFAKNGKVNKDDVMDHLMAVLPVKTALRETLAPVPQKLNLPSCQALLERLQGSWEKTRRRQPPQPPDIEKQSEWFTFWDIYEDGMLDRKDATRALLKSLDKKYDRLMLRAAIDEVWPEVVASFIDEETEPESVTAEFLLTRDQMFEPNKGLVARVMRKAQASFHWKLLREFNPG
eukprot:gnl/MRDRNA2_/MRDRNA2_88533_c0_seq1.p1 gnl/MRDRNA2_/MRDRNA2_88533_c0~~gnl/MRDRNA2_/MRDRNA2_88533_c0_seq1.p1  ORF type:complete len:645 (+),score=113.00 gnl/MRDRNA2_/MRDRNA2_88533_c0_seq1:69-1937(+)